MGETSSQTVTRLPAPSLRHLIDRYIGYRLRNFPAGVHRGLPTRHLTFIVSIGQPIDVTGQTDPQQPPDRYDVVVGGLQTSPALIAHDGNQEGVAVELTPLGCRAVLGVPARALWNTSLEADGLLGRAAGEMRERLHLVDDWPGRFAAVDDVLCRLVDVRTPVAPEVGEAWRVVVSSGGMAPVHDVAAHVGWSRRHLAQRFGEEFGLSPKLAARVVRFERACRMLQRTEGGLTIAEVAAACGYYDQPHLNRDFVELAGCPPGEWLAVELPSVQDGEVVEDAESVP